MSRKGEGNLKTLLYVNPSVSKSILDKDTVKCIQLPYQSRYCYCYLLISSARYKYVHNKFCLCLFLLANLLSVFVFACPFFLTLFLVV